MVLACGVEASFCTSLDEQRVNELLSKCCFVFVQVACKKVAVFAVARLWWVFPVTKSGKNVGCCCGVVRQRQAQTDEYGAQAPATGSGMGANKAGQGL